MVQGVKDLTALARVAAEVRVQSLALLNGLRIRHCHELWCRLQTRLRSHVSVAMV